VQGQVVAALRERQPIPTALVPLSKVEAATILKVLVRVVLVRVELKAIEQLASVASALGCLA